MNGLGPFIAERRRAKGLRAQDLAEQAGIPAHWIRALENGRINTLPAPERLRAIAAALDVPVRALLDAAGYGEPAP